MSSLRRGLKRPETYLALLALLLALAGWDSLLPAHAQVTARMYLAGIDAYQRYGSPAVSRVATCRFRPTCSEYSKQAVSKFGIGRGLALTMERLRRCR